MQPLSHSLVALTLAAALAAPAAANPPAAPAAPAAAPAAKAPAAKALSAEDEADLQNIESLRREGSDLKKPHDTRYFSNFPNQAAAEAAAKDLKADGFTVVRSESAGKDLPWVLILGRKMTMTIENVRIARKSMFAAARKHGGRYDGWEAFPVLPKKK